MSSIALVTGANRGLGYATASALAERGHLVVLAGRDPSSLDAAVRRLADRGLAVEAQTLDVVSTTSIQRAADEVSARHGRLDVLVNNAGILPEATQGTDAQFANPEVFAATMQTNVFGAVAVIEAFLPLLHRSPAGRVVNVSSVVGSLTDQTDPTSPYYAMVLPAYQASKAALNSVTIGLSKKLAGTPIKVTAVCPGYVQTGLTPSNVEQAPLTADEAAAVVVAAAMLPDDAASGTFVDSAGAVAW